MKTKEHADLKPFNTFRLDGVARYMADIATEEDIAEAYEFAKAHGVPIVVLGGGSNVIFKGGDLEVLVARVVIPGISIVGETEEHADVFIGAGENWDGVVEWAVSHNLSGVEAMSGIPGTAGATPIQNVGAYGQEIKDTLVSLRAYDTADGKFKKFSNKECELSYRDSIFRRERGRYVISGITLRLSKLSPGVPSYPGVNKQLSKSGIKNPGLKEIREIIIKIRASNLPDPRVVASVGCFFKNPFVSKKHLETIKEKYPNIVAYPAGEDRYKLAAGWMVEELGFRGKEFGNLACHSGNSLVIVNKGGATHKELKVLVAHIIERVEEAFSVTLEMEPIEI